jgi:hypothetical protein
VPVADKFSDWALRTSEIGQSLRDVRRAYGFGDQEAFIAALLYRLFVLLLVSLGQCVLFLLLIRLVVVCVLCWLVHICPEGACGGQVL